MFKTKEDFAALETIRSKGDDTYEATPEILWVNEVPTTMLGNFSNVQVPRACDSNISAMWRIEEYEVLLKTFSANNEQVQNSQQADTEQRRHFAIRSERIFALLARTALNW